MKLRNLRQVRRELVNETRIASPCQANWDEMEGDDKVRFCRGCRLHVYNLSAMEVEEAAEVLTNREGRLCASFYRRKDGTVLTQDCPTGVEYRNGRRAVIRSVGITAAASVGIGSLIGLRTSIPGRTAGIVANISPEHAPVFAAASGDLDTLTRQLEAGWDPNTRLESGATALMLAAASGETQAMRLLIDHGADVNAKSADGRTAFHWAMETREWEAIKLLKTAGAR